MNYLSAENIAKSYGDKILFSKISFGIDKGQKVALVAKNGTGKTTLLKILAGIDSPDEGQVTTRNGIEIGFLDQSDEIKELTVKDYFFNGSKYEVVKQYEELLEKDPSSLAFQAVLEKMNELNAWDIEQEAQKILSAFGLNHFTRDTKTMSGGEIKRLTLAKVLFDKPDLLILDEPTNHLDLDMIEWLQDFLTQQNITLFMVTHDRYFLDQVCNEIIEIEEGELYKYKGNFSYYLEKRAERLINEQQQIDKATNLFKKELDWIRRQPKARGTKAKSRVDAFDDIKEKASQKINDNTLQLSVKSQRMGTKILEFHNVSKSFGADKPILKNFSYIFKRYEKIGIVGKNGVGKTSFVNLIMDTLKPDTGKIVVGETINLGYYDQKGLTYKEDQKVIDVVKEIAEYIPLEKGKTLTAGQLLENFFFPKHMHYQYVYKLSGGEQKRLALLKILMKNPNFLILDEPTNDLDIFTISALENFLENFNGCLLVISHDRYFLDKICDHLFYLKGKGELKDIFGNYTAYRAQLKFEDQNKIKAKQTTGSITKQTAKKEIGTYEQRKEYQKLEREIAKLEDKKQKITQKMYNFADNQEELLKLTSEIENTNNQIEEKTEKWMKLAELFD